MTYFKIGLLRLLAEKGTIMVYCKTGLASEFQFLWHIVKLNSYRAKQNWQWEGTIITCCNN